MDILHALQNLPDSVAMMLIMFLLCAMQVEDSTTKITEKWSWSGAYALKLGQIVCLSLCMSSFPLQKIHSVVNCLKCC